MHPAITYELRITFVGSDQDRRQTKKELIALLPLLGVEEFVEGIIDDLDIDNEYTGEVRDFYGELGGDLLPVSIFKYSSDFLRDIEGSVREALGSRVDIVLLESDTQDWMEGWKESFKPIETKKFYVYPPWDLAPVPESKLPLVIEPGMAFGTGQHATTMLCLQLLEGEVLRAVDPRQCRLLDVGTGTGILALAAMKLGFKYVLGTDIDPDAVSAAGENVKLNHINACSGKLEFRKASVPSENQLYDVAVANILFVVLKTLVAKIALQVRTDGLVVFSGVLESDFDEIHRIAHGAGLSLVTDRYLEGWCGLLYKKAPRA